MEQTEGIVLRSFDFRETSTIVVFYTRDFGVLKGLAKGARVKKKEFGSSLELYSHDYITFYRSRNGEIHLIGKCEPKNFYAGIREDLKKSYLAIYWMEIIQELIRDRDEKLFEFLLSSLEHLEKELNFSPLILSFFELNLLKLAGYGPMLSGCVSCKRESDSYKFSPNLGGIVCPDCSFKDGRSIDISLDTISLMRTLTKIPMDNLSRIIVSPKLLGQVKGVIHYYLFHSIGKRPKSLQFFEKIITEKEVMKQ